MLSFSRAKAKHLKLGSKGEVFACSYLQNKGMDILFRNYKVSSGEIDIIGRNGSMICFIEVKTRRNTGKSRPAENLPEKQKIRIHRTAMHYLREIGRPKLVYRFDLIEIIFSRWDISELRYWPNHFS